MQRYIEEQKKKMEAQLAAMTPEERADAEKKFAAMREADEAAMRKTLDDCRRAVNGRTPYRITQEQVTLSAEKA